MSALFDVIFEAFASSAYIAALGAFVWGICSVVLSPCGVAMIPLVVGYIENNDVPDYKSAFFISCAFCSGIFLNLILVGVIFIGAGAALRGYDTALNYFVSAVFLLMGLHLMRLIDVKRLPLIKKIIKVFSYKESDIDSKKGLWGAFALGALSGLALGPCSFAYATPVLSFAAASARTSHIAAASLVLAYALGHCAVLIAAGTFTEFMSGLLNADSSGRAARAFNFICGLGLVAAAAYFAYNAAPL